MTHLPTRRLLRASLSLLESAAHGSTLNLLKLTLLSARNGLCPDTLGLTALPLFGCCRLDVPIREVLPDYPTRKGSAQHGPPAPRPAPPAPRALAATRHAPHFSAHTRAGFPLWSGAPRRGGIWLRPLTYLRCPGKCWTHSRCSRNVCLTNECYF